MVRFTVGVAFAVAWSVLPGWARAGSDAPACQATTCAAQHRTCGSIPDGCGGTLDCGAACTPSECFHEDQEIQFAPPGSAFQRAGLIMHDGGDFGDTAQREGWYWLGVWIRQNELAQPWTDTPPRTLSFDEVLRKLEPHGDGVFVRAPGKDPFGRAMDGFDHHGTTRDQLVPLIAAMAAWGKRDALQRLWNALPEDVLGKHDFQGHWHNLLTNEDFYTADPCNDIKNRDCTQRVDTRDCSHGGVCGRTCAGAACLDLCPCEERGCPSDCTTNNCHTECPCGTCGDFNCRTEVCLPLLGCHTECPCGGCGDMNCRVQVCVPGVDLDCEARRLDCERLRQQEAVACHAAEAGCTAAKETQNALYAAEAATCGTQRLADVALCISQKQSGVLHFTGDPLLPMTYNLLVRSGVTPLSVFPATVSAVSPPGFAIGEANLVGAIDVLRNQASGDLTCAPSSSDRLDCVDQDMNSLAMLWMSRHKVATPLSESALASYRSRAHSYGSYFGAYCQAYGPLLSHGECAAEDPACCRDKSCLNVQLTERMKAGIASGWPPDGPGIGPYGALRWYHRWTTGANPRLSVLWRPVVDSLLR
jgi:hypothetical protein